MLFRSQFVLLDGVCVAITIPHGPVSVDAIGAVIRNGVSAGGHRTVCEVDG